MASAIEKALQGVKLTEQQKRQLARMPPNMRLEAVAKLRKSQQDAGLIAVAHLTPIIQPRVERVIRVDSKTRSRSTSTLKDSKKEKGPSKKRSIFSRKHKREHRDQIKEAEGIPPQVLLKATLDQEPRRVLFDEFCKLNYCDENLEFFVEISTYAQRVSTIVSKSGRATTDDPDIVQLVAHILSRYLEPGSVREVNIDYTLRERTIEKAKEPPYSMDTFAESASIIFKLIEHDTFAKYLQSDLWQQHKAQLAEAGFTHASVLENKTYAEDATEFGTEAESNPTISNDEVSEASATNISDDEGDD